MQISTETWVSPFSGKAPPALQRAAAVSTSNYPPSAGEEMPWSFGWGAELLNQDWHVKEKTDLKVQRRDLQERNCVKKTKSETKQSEDLHRFC